MELSRRQGGKSPCQAEKSPREDVDSSSYGRGSTSKAARKVTWRPDHYCGTGDDWNIELASHQSSSIHLGFLNNLPSGRVRFEPIQGNANDRGDPRSSWTHTHTASSKVGVLLRKEMEAPERMISPVSYPRRG